MKQGLTKIFLLALIANTILLISLLGLGGAIRKSSIEHMNDMGIITMQAVRGVRPFFMNSRMADSPQLRDFVQQLTEQSTIRNIVAYDKNKNIIFSYIEPNPEMLIYPVPQRSIITRSSMYIYSDSAGAISDWGTRWQRGNMGTGAGRHHMPDIEDMLICIEMDATSIAATAHMRNISFLIALLMEVVLILFYSRLKKMIKSYELSQQNLQIAQQEAATGRLASILAHEIKNPLSSIKGLVSFAAKKTTDEQTLDNLNRSIDEVDRLTAIVNGFLSFGKPVELEKTKFSLQAICAKASELLQHDIMKDNKTVKVSGDDITLEADYNKLLQVLVNLILNALDAAPANSSVDIRIDSTGNQMLIINNVAENQTVDAEKLFEPFYTTKTHGSGLGMAIARKIIEIHGYRIDVPQTSPFVVRIKWGA